MNRYTDQHERGNDAIDYGASERKDGARWVTSCFVGLDDGCCCGKARRNGKRDGTCSFQLKKTAPVPLNCRQATANECVGVQARQLKIASVLCEREEREGRRGSGG